MDVLTRPGNGVHIPHVVACTHLNVCRRKNQKTRKLSQALNKFHITTTETIRNTFRLYSKYNVILLAWLKRNFDTATWKIICNCYSHLPVCLLLDRYYDPDLILPVILKCDPISVRELRRELLRKLQNLLLPFWAHWYSQARQSLIINSATSKQTNGSFIHFLAFLYCYIVYFIYFILSFTLG